MFQDGFLLYIIDKNDQQITENLALSIRDTEAEQFPTKIFRDWTAYTCQCFTRGGGGGGGEPPFTTVLWFMYERS